MREHFLKYLIDPVTGQDLTIESIKEIDGRIVEGFLVSKENRYRILNGIPRFIEPDDNSNYAKSFGYQWNKWPKVQFDSENVGRPMEGYTRRMWERITGITSTLEEMVIVDFGCGSGRFIETVRNKQGIAIGIDMSEAVEVAGKNFASDPSVLICQADILKSPIRPLSIDGAYSIGVLHHTKDAKLGFDKMVQCLKKGGWISVSVYSPGGYYDNFFVNIYRQIFKKLWPVFRHYPPLIYTYVTVYMFRPILRIPIIRTIVRPLFTFTPFINLKDTEWSVLDTFDSVTPSNQYTYTMYQVFNWFKSADLLNIEPSNWAGSSFKATR